MLLSVDLGDSHSSRSAPSKEHYPIGSNSSNEIDNFLCELLPSLVGMAVGLVGTNSEACVEHQNATLGPRREKPTFISWRLEVRIVNLDSLVDIDQRRWGSDRGSDGEAQAMGLVMIVIGILANNYHFNGVQRCVSGPAIWSAHGNHLPQRAQLPGIDVFFWREDLNIGVLLLFEESLQVKKLCGHHLILQVS